MTKDDFFKCLPTFYRDIDVLEYIFTAVASRLNLLTDKFTRLMSSYFIYSDDIDENGVDRLGESLQIDLSGLDFDDKVFKIKTVLLDKRPYNRVNVREMLSSLCGENGYSIGFDEVNKIVSAKIDLGKKNQFTAVYELLDKVIPADMMLNVELLYNLYGDLSAKTHGELSAMTHEELRSDILQ